MDSPTLLRKLLNEVTSMAARGHRPPLQCGLHGLHSYVQTMERHAFARIVEQARHQYVLAYISNSVVLGSSPVNRKIEVKTDRRGLK
jgi:hypothetical protein